MNAGKSERASKAWMNSVRMIGARLTQEDVQAWVTNCEFNISQQEIILSMDYNPRLQHILPSQVETEKPPEDKPKRQTHSRKLSRADSPPPEF